MVLFGNQPGPISQGLANLVGRSTQPIRNVWNNGLFGSGPAPKFFGGNAPSSQPFSRADFLRSDGALNPMMEMIDSPNLYPDVWEQEMDPAMADPERQQLRFDLRAIFNDRGGPPGPSLRNLPSQTKQSMGTIFGAANSAGRMVNASYGNGSSGSPRRLTDEQIVKGDIYGTPNYQQQEGFQTNLPPEVQLEMDKWRAKNAAGTDPSKLAAYNGQFGSMPDMNKVTQYISSVPQQLMSGIQRTMQQSLGLVRDARLRFNPNDVVANAQLSNKHITNQAFNQPGAQFMFPEGNQKANTLLAYGADVDPEAMNWANNADSLTDEIYGGSIKNGQFGSTIKPAYQSSTMGWGGPSVVQTGDGDYETRLAAGLAEGPHTPYTMNPRNNNDPRYFRTPGTGNQRSPNNAPPLNGNPGATPSRSGLPSGWSSLGGDSRNRGTLQGVRYGDGTANGYRQSAYGGQAGYQGQTGWDRNGRAIFGGGYMNQRSFVPQNGF